MRRDVRAAIDALSTIPDLKYRITPMADRPNPTFFGCVASNFLMDLSKTSVAVFRSHKKTAEYRQGLSEIVTLVTKTGLIG